MSTLYTDPPQSRNEAIIKSTIDGTQYTDPPQSRMEDLLLDLKEAIEQGGGGGTTVVANPEGEATDDLEKLQVGSDIYEIPKDYEDLDNKPQINGETLDGNKTASDLGLQTELDGAQTVEGNPITITDAEAMNAESVVVELEPKQDLHGYDNPWVGGAGKNIGQLSTSNIQSVNGHQNDNETYANNGVIVTSTGNYGRCGYQFSVESGKTYTISMMVKKSASMGGGGILFGYTTNWDFEYGDFRDDAITTSLTKITKTFTAVDDVLYVGVYPNTNGVSITIEDFMIEEGEQATTYEPYSNICPISGYSEVNVERVGKNWLDKGQTPLTAFINGVGEVVYSESDKALICKVTPSTRYTLSFSRSIISGYDDYQIAEFENAPTYGDYGHLIANQPSGDIVSNFETSQNTHYIVVKIANVNQTNYNETVDTAQLELGNQATTYEPYQGSTATISLGGTKYGGTLDVTEGGYSDEWGYYTIDGDSVTVRGDSAPFVVDIPDGMVITATDSTVEDMICDSIQVNSIQMIVFNNKYGIGVSKTSTYIYLRLPSECGSNASEVNTWLQSNPISIAYHKTPSSVSTTPTDIALLENTNNISTDGTNIELKYQPNNVIGECKVYTDEQCAKVLPPLPTTDGTYHLSCEVTSGVGVLSWVSDS